MLFQPIPAFQFLTDPKIPLGSRRFRAAFGGRGSAKSWEFANAAIFHTATNANFRAVFVREVQANLKESSLELVRSRLREYGLLNTYFSEVDNEFKGRDGQKIMFTGLWKGNKPEGIKSLEGVNLTILEEASEVTERSLDVLIPTIMRTPTSELWAIWNPKSQDDPIDKYFRGSVKPPKCICRKVNFDQNPYFPDAMREIMDADRRKDPLRASWIWDGEYMPSIQNSLWTRQGLDQAWRQGHVYDGTYGRVVVGVDPSGGGDDVGIVVAASIDRRGDQNIILADWTCEAKNPMGWATQVAKACKTFGADCVVAERNFGGDMVESTLRAAGVNVRIEMVTASRGKHIRAEPVASLYSQGRVWHKEPFAKLESEMLLVSPTGYHGTKSPNRLDAAVWALWSLADLGGKEIKVMVA